ncbi:hypothetical protein CHS0354_004555 [Potamilus streckersoni]|uniref:Uncharacterized protein n=1 Tax=Potamilus streckersoni TaxID=2493646 RepID=A0AAE0S579_9BIVA|nr:hypothetical protein CHS0354_004555 [Potamilus streckersoni]
MSSYQGIHSCGWIILTLANNFARQSTNESIHVDGLFSHWPITLQVSLPMNPFMWMDYSHMASNHASQPTSESHSCGWIIFTLANYLVSQPAIKFHSCRCLILTDK